MKILRVFKVNHHDNKYSASKWNDSDLPIGSNIENTKTILIGVAKNERKEKNVQKRFNKDINDHDNVIVMFSYQK